VAGRQQFNIRMFVLNCGGKSLPTGTGEFRCQIRTQKFSRG